MKRKDLILKAKGDVIAEADSFGHGGGFVAVADLTEFVRENIVEDSANVANPADSDVLHTVRKSADATFDFYLPRGKKEIALQGIEGEPIYLFQAEAEERTGSYTVHRNGVLVVKRA